MWQNAEITDELKLFAKKLGCDWIGAVRVESQPAYDYNNCHNNVNIHTKVYGGKEVIGYYFVSGFGTIQGIRHTVWGDKELIDVTPYPDDREYIIFGKSKNQDKDYSIDAISLDQID